MKLSKEKTKKLFGELYRTVNIGSGLYGVASEVEWYEIGVGNNNRSSTMEIGIDQKGDLVPLLTGKDWNESGAVKAYRAHFATRPTPRGIRQVPG